MHLRHCLLMVIAAVFLSGCEVTEARYQDRTEVASRNAFQSGWLPEWIPDDAFDIRETHDSDTNESWLVFRLKSGHWKNPDECASQESPVLSSPRVMQRFPRFARDAWQRVGEGGGEIRACAGRRWVMWDPQRQLVYSWTGH